MKFFCETCGQRLEVADEYAGHMIHCPSCEVEMQIPVGVPAVTDQELKEAIHDSMLDSGHGAGAMTINQFMSQRQMDGGVQIGEVLTEDQNQKYNYGEVIARGGMGAILKAGDLNIRRNVAIKVLLDPEAASNDDLLRFIEEAQVTGQLEHPSVVPVHDLGIDGAGNVFYTMKLVNGETLHEILSRIGNGNAIEEYSLNRLLNIFQKVCEAMAFSHSKGVIHRDLKPENIMVGEFGEVLVMDWGLAKVLGQTRDDPHVTAEQINSVRQQDATGALATLAGTIFGTPQFMAPEQAVGDTAAMDQRTDIYALGAILYNILSLRPPVEGKTVDEVLTKVSKGQIETPTVYNTQKPKKSTKPRRRGTAPARIIELKHCPAGKIPPPLAAIVMKAMATEREQRYQAVKDLADDIESYQRGFATSAESAGALKLLTLFVLRNKLATFSAIAISVLGIGFATKTISSAREIQQVSRKAAPEFVEKAREALAQNRDDEARDALETALGLDRQSSDAWYQQARLQFDSYDFKSAQTSLAKARDLSNSDHAKLDQFSEVLEKWKSIVDEDGRGVLPDHLIEMAPEIQNVDPTLAARFFSRVGDQQESLKIRVSQVMKDLLEANPGLEYYEDTSQDWPMDIGYFYWHHVFRETGMEMQPGGYTKDRKKLVNIEPLTTLPFRVLNLHETGVSDLSPIGRISSLRSLDISSTPVLSLEGLRGLQLEGLNIHNLRVEDLSPLSDMPLKRLGATSLKAPDLSALKNLKLEAIDLTHYPLEDIEALRGMPLEKVILNGANKLRSIEPLRGMPITQLDLSHNYEVDDISMIADMPLTSLVIGTPKDRNLSVISNKDFDYLKIATDISDIEFLHNNIKVKKLELNYVDSLTNIEPIQTQRDSLESLSINANIRYSKLEDLSPLRGLNLEWVHIRNIPVSDLSPLSELPLKSVDLLLPNATHVEALKGLRLNEATLGGGFTDLSALAGKERLTTLYLHDCKKLTDINFLSTLPNLHRVTLPESAENIEILRGKPNLTQIGVGYGYSAIDQFWQEYDASR